jgi:hypothetical protein
MPHTVPPERMSPAVEPALYASPGYLTRERFLALREQLCALQQLNASSVLEVGPGPGFLTSLLRKGGISVTTLDFDARLQPDLVGDVTDIRQPDGRYDVACAFQVLEHIPWQHVGIALRELARVSRRHVVFSVPDHEGLNTTTCGVTITILGRSLSWSFKRKRFKDLSNSAEHNWEIGCRDVTVASVKEAIQSAGLICVRDYLPCAYFHFFVCTVQPGSGTVNSGPHSKAE